MRQIARQESEPLAGLHGRPRQHDALDDVALERINGGRYSKVGFAGSGRADADRDVMLQHRRDVVALARGATVQVAATCMQLWPPFAVRWRRFFAPAALLDKIELDIVDRHRSAGAPCAVEEVLEHVHCGLRGSCRALDAELVPAPRNRDVELGFDLPDIGVERAGDVCQVVVVRVRGERENLLRVRVAT